MLPRSCFALILGAAVLPACTVGPNFKPVETSVEPTWGEASAAASQPSRPTTAAIPITRWWQTFHDDQLNTLVTDAVRNNEDLGIAAARIRQARAQRSIVAADLFPELDAGAGYNHSRGSKNVALPLGSGARSDNSAGTPAAGSAGAGTAVPFAAGTDPPPPASASPIGAGGLPGISSDLYQVGFDATWELDIFGGHRRDLEAANADLAAAVESRREVMVSLLAELARNYFALRGAQLRLQVAQDNLAAQRQILDITRARRQSGLATDLDVTQAAAEVAATSATMPPLQAQIRLAIHALSTLLTRNPDDLAADLLSQRPLPAIPPEVPVGLPSDLLRRRPDIRRAQLQVHAATARIGSATADLLPKFNLTGQFGLDSTTLTHLFDWQSHYFMLNPTVSWPIFDAGRIVSNISLQQAHQDEAILQYRKIVRTALQEVEDALISYATEQMRYQALAESLAQNKESLAIAREQYKNGLTNFINVLDAQRSLLAAQDAQAQSQQRLATNLVALYKALGGGWETDK